MARPNRLDQLIDAWDPILRRAFLRAIYEVRSGAQIENIARMLERGDVDGAVRAVGLDPVQFRALDQAIAEAFEAGGNFTANQLPVTRTSDGLRMVVRFNVRNIEAENWLRLHSSQRITEIIEDQRTMTRGALTNSMIEGVNPRTAALDLVGRVGASGRREGGLIGLTSSQEEWVRNYARDLDELRPGALTRALRDKRFDGTVRKAIENGEPIPAETRAAMIRNYKNRALRHRAEAISRTEAMASLHASQDIAIKQAIASGAISADQVRFIWRATFDRRTRDTHRALHGQSVKMGEFFQSPSGALIEYPGDPRAPAGEIINCRCFREPRIDFLAGIR